MVHQSPRSSAEYAELMLKWGEHFTCIAPDTPGFGQSDALPLTDGREPEINDFADALAEFVSALGIAQCPAYGFHSGGIILVTAVKRHPKLFSALAIGGYAIWTKAEMDLFGESYLPEWHPSDYGEHLTWLWNRMLEQSWFFPWFDIRDETRLTVAHADVARVNQAVSEMLDAGNDYRAGYGAVLRAPRDIPEDDSAPPCLITAYDGDPLQSHIDRLGTMPSKWRAEKVATPQDHQAASLAFLQDHADAVPCPDLAEEENEGWLPIGNGLIHWRGDKSAGRLTLHGPAAQMEEENTGALAIDVPGHGYSSAYDDMAGTIKQAAELLGAKEIEWPSASLGDPDQLYPDLIPDRFGSHLTRAWSAARAQAMFEPWYSANYADLIPVKAEDLAPSNLAKRAYARLRASDAAKRFHNLLLERDNNS
ncbi:MAG: alpha/beta fold hydrolase [Erythrobacter sp.]